MAKTTGTAQLYEIKITLLGLERAPWRRVQVRADIPLSKLHLVIQDAMGWTDSHMHEFVARGRRYGAHLPDDDLGDNPPISETKVRLQDVAGLRQCLTYVYDFGDNWEHEIKVERAVPAEPGVKTPRCIAGENACPPDDCGGVWRYAEMLETLAGPESEERAEIEEWLGEEFDPGKFDPAEVNKHLTRIKP